MKLESEASPTVRTTPSRPNTRPKSDTPPTAEPNIKPRPKTGPKGKGDARCTANQKKTGRCLDPKKKKDWEVLTPTKGCRPKGCRNDGKPKGEKSNKKGGKTIRDFLHSLTLIKRVATAEPASKTEAGLMDWTMNVWASSPRVLPLPPDSLNPTSFFIPWSSSEQGTKFVTVKSLIEYESRKGTRWLSIN